MTRQPSPSVRKQRSSPRASACAMAVETWIATFDEDTDGELSELGHQIDLGAMIGRETFAFDDE